MKIAEVKEKNGEIIITVDGIYSLAFSNRKEEEIEMYFEEIRKLENKGYIILRGEVSI